MGQKLRNIAGNNPTFHTRFTDIFYDRTSKPLQHGTSKYLGGIKHNTDP